MRYLVISDIHANMDAFEAVLRDSSPDKYDEIVVLGDLVGYGAEPNQVVDRIRGLKPVAIVRGNHDKVAAGLEDAEDFNPVAKAAAEWTQGELTKDSLDYLRALPIGPQTVADAMEICHGSPLDEDQYLVGELDVLSALAAMRRPLCFFGHTHVAMCARLGRPQGMEICMPDGSPELVFQMDPDAKYLINPGSIGQPRDGDPRAAYAILDMARQVVTLYRVKYPIKSAQTKILAAGLPPMLAQRLAVGR